MGVGTRLELDSTATKLIHTVHLYSFCFHREIRQEVSFLAVLDHPNLTKLCGVRTSPYMCLLLELAPHGSLQHMLKVYKKCEVVLEPMTLKTSIYQVNGLV